MAQSNVGTIGQHARRRSLQLAERRVSFQLERNTFVFPEALAFFAGDVYTSIFIE
jgi:hypothetical protein